ncbi:hypothetical protein AVEN_23153-1 [Araneus ventricosus]|uniref:ribonuclease H n=1 Tax=Araneus ventricosus TaxID=182803 RepID=A0A4Y2FHN2_ARAVE|nr:hypothetical protein AVEN_23153-1 [Araneus ventricosus]
MVRSPKITWNGYNINRVKSFKYLGIHVDDRLNWLEHINKQGDKAIKIQLNLKRISKPKQISLEDREANIARRKIINIFTDGSKTEPGDGAAFYVFTNDIWADHWSAKLNDNNTVFQAELTALHEAVICAYHLPNHNTSKTHVDNRASIRASSNSKSTNETARKIFKILLSNPRIKVSWVKAHAGNIGNETADQLAKDATQHGQPYSHTKLPKPRIKSLLRKRMLEEWQTSWKNGDTGKKIYKIMPSVNVRPTNWIREDLIFFSQHIPFPAYLKKVSPISQRLLQLWWNWHGISLCHDVYSHSVLTYGEASAKLRKCLSEKNRQYPRLQA